MRNVRDLPSQLLSNMLVVFWVNSSYLRIACHKARPGERLNGEPVG
jgi:hypothetical protein